MPNNSISVNIASARQCIVCLKEVANSIHLDMIKANTSTNGNQSESASAGAECRDMNIVQKIPFQCSRCNMVEYCSLKHQNTDLTEHKEFCDLMLMVKKTCKVKHPLLLHGNNMLDAPNLLLCTRQLKLMFYLKLKREPTKREEELISYPAYCVICFSLDNLIHCENCFGVSYCAEAHQTEDQGRHKEECNKLRLYYSLYQMVPLQRDPFKELYMRVSNLQDYDLCSTVERATLVKVPTDPTASFADYSTFVNVSSFSYIGSICFGMSYIDVNSRNDFKIFIVGATDEQDLYFHEMHMKFFFLQNDKLNNVELHFIGPNAVNMEPTTLQFMFKKKLRTVVYKCFVGLFQDYMKVDLTKPSFIIAYNPDFSGRHDITKHYVEEYQQKMPAKERLPNSKLTWPAGLDEIVNSLRVPIFFTSPTKLESTFDYGCVLKAAVESKTPITCSRIFKMTTNPYAELRPQRNMLRGDGEPIYYKNAYIQGVYTLP